MLEEITYTLLIIASAITPHQQEGRQKTDFKFPQDNHVFSCWEIEKELKYSKQRIGSWKPL